MKRDEDTAGLVIAGGLLAGTYIATRPSIQARVRGLFTRDAPSSTPPSSTPAPMDPAEPAPLVNPRVAIADDMMQRLAAGETRVFGPEGVYVQHLAGGATGTDPGAGYYLVAYSSVDRGSSVGTSYATPTEARDAIVRLIDELAGTPAPGEARLAAFAAHDLANAVASLFKPAAPVPPTAEQPGGGSPPGGSWPGPDIGRVPGTFLPVVTAPKVATGLGNVLGAGLRDLTLRAPQSFVHGVGGVFSTVVGVVEPFIPEDKQNRAATDRNLEEFFGGLGKALDPGGSTVAEEAKRYDWSKLRFW